MAGFGLSQDTAFVHTYGGDSFEEARCIVPSASGGFILAGTTGSQQDQTTNAYVLKIDNSLNCSWYLNQGGFGVEQLSDVVEDADGNIIAVGYGSVNPDSGYDVLIMKLNSTGEVLWQRSIGGDGWQFADEVVIHPNGGYLLAGSNIDMINGNDALLFYLDSDGNVLNEFYFGGPFQDEFHFLAVHDSLIYAGGSMGTSDTTECSWTVQLDLNFNTIHADTLFTYDKSRLEYMDFHGDTIFTLHTYYIDSINARGSFFSREEFGNLIWSFDGNNFEAREIRYNNNLIYLPGTNSLFGLGGTAASICLFHNDGYFLECPSFGDLGDDGFSAMSFRDGVPILVGESNSYSSFGDNDVYAVMLSDSLVMGIILWIFNMTTALRWVLGKKSMRIIPRSRF